MVLEAMPWISLALVLYSLWIFIHHYQVYNRKRIEGVVKKSTLVSEFNGGMNNDSMFRYFADLEFEFEVDERVVLGKRTSSVHFNSTVDPLATEKLRHFPVGKKVAVYLNEKAPEKSIVENLFPYSIYLVGLIALVIYMLHDALVYTIYQRLL